MAAAGKARSAAGDSSRPRRVAMVAFDGANVIDVTGPLEVFSQVGRQRYDWAGSAYQTILLAPRAGEITTSSGVRLVAAKAFHAERGPLDTLIVAGGDVRVAARDERLLAWLRRMRPRVRRLASVCTGAFVLAQAGLLAGRRATTHWGSAARLAERYPDVSVDGDAIYVRDGDVYTSAGVTAGMDLALALVEEDHGRDAALAVARQLVLFLKRPGGQAQFSSHLAA
jgi:transcriptional regulator GlxA family with amidase domain